MAPNKHPPPRRLARDEAGAESIISTVLLLAIMISVSGGMLAWGIPQLQRSEALASFTATHSNFEALEGQMEAVLMQGEGASRTGGIASSAGLITLNSKGDRWLMVWTLVDWAELSLTDVALEQTSFKVQDLTSAFGVPPQNWRVTLTWPANGTTLEVGLQNGRAEFGTPLTPPLEGTVQTANNTIVGGFRWFDPDVIKYRYPSVTGVYAIQLANGGVLVKEPGAIYRVTNAPLVLGQGPGQPLRSMVFNLVELNSSSSPVNIVTAGRWTISLSNAGSTVIAPDPVYALHLQFFGPAKKAWLNYFYLDHGFIRSSTQDEVSVSQAEPFNLMIIETEIQIRFGVR